MFTTGHVLLCKKQATCAAAAPDPVDAGHCCTISPGGAAVDTGAGPATVAAAEAAALPIFPPKNLEFAKNYVTAVSSMPPPPSNETLVPELTLDELHANPRAPRARSQARLPTHALPADAAAGQQLREGAARRNAPRTVARRPSRNKRCILYATHVLLIPETLCMQ